MDNNIIELCESIMENHRAIRAVRVIFDEFDFETDNGNAFQGKIQKKWFISVIEEMILRQFDRLNHIIDIYNQDKENLNDGLG